MSGTFFVLNDGVYDHGASQRDIESSLENLCRALIHAVSLDRRVALVGSGLFSLQPAPNVHLSTLLANPSNTDLKKFLLRLLSKYEYSFEELVELYDHSSIQVFLDESAEVGESAYLAYMSDTPLASLGVGPWGSGHVEVTVVELTEEGLLESHDRSLLNVSSADHLAHHSDWFERQAPEELTIREMWKEKADIFPHLRFLPSVESQIRSLGSEEFKSVLTRLRELEHALGRWDPDKEAFPSWLSKVTPESDTRESLCWFDVGEALQLFSLHARYTPGAGRIHMHLENSRQLATIGYIGSKIGA